MLENITPAQVPEVEEVTQILGFNAVNKWAKMPGAKISQAMTAAANAQTVASNALKAVANAMPKTGGTFTGSISAPTPERTSNGTRVATTAFVKTAIANSVVTAGDLKRIPLKLSLPQDKYVDNFSATPYYQNQAVIAISRYADFQGGETLYLWRYINKIRRLNGGNKNGDSIYGMQGRAFVPVYADGAGSITSGDGNHVKFVLRQYDSDLNPSQKSQFMIESAENYSWKDACFAGANMGNTVISAGTPLWQWIYKRFAIVSSFSDGFQFRWKGGHSKLDRIFFNSIDSAGLYKNSQTFGLSLAPNGPIQPFTLSTGVVKSGTNQLTGYFLGSSVVFNSARQRKGLRLYMNVP